MTRRLIAGAFAGLILAACQPAGQPDANQSAAPASVSPSPSPPMGPTDDGQKGTFKAKAVIVQVVDAGYPMFALTVDLENGKPPVGMLFNNEYAVKRPAALEIASLVGKRANLSYTRKTELHMQTMALSGKDILRHEPGDPKPNPNLTVTGKLFGVKERSHGDLPDKLTITDSAGKTYEFEAFVSETAVVAADGQIVTVGYDTDVQTDIDEISVPTS